MSDKTEISWTDATWNPTTGCTKVSPACAHCYIERTPPFRMKGRKFVKGHIPLELHSDRLHTPLRWRQPKRVFVNSLSDLFHDEVSDAFIADVFATMARAPQHTFQILTKRAERMKTWMEHGSGWMTMAVNFSKSPIPGMAMPWPLPNVWLGVSVENQHFADERIPLLLQMPAAVRFISAEPLLGLIDIRPYLPSEGYNTIPPLDWVIAGGESGPKARPSHPDWFRSLRDQCQAAGVAFHFKQWGEWATTVVRAGGDLGGDMRRGHTQILHGPGNPGGHFRRGDAMVSRVGKKAAGRLLDGREWNEFPGVPA